MLPGTGRLQEQTWDKVRMTVGKRSRTVFHRTCQFTEASAAGRLPGGSSHDVGVL